MKIYDSFEQFWNAFASEKRNAFGFHDWQVVQITHTSDVEYRQQVQSGQDELGFQPLSVVLANPFLRQTRQAVIKNVTDKTAEGFKDYCRKQYYNELPSRYGSFRPDEFHAFAAYDSWESFYTTWLEREGKQVFYMNIPLLFDHMPQVEYWTRKQTGQEVLPYHRLLVTTYFVHKRQFFDFIIKDVDDAKIEQIKLLMGSRIGLNLEMLYSDKKAAHV